MQVKDAVKTAVMHVKDLFAGEDVTNIGLEEVVFDPTNSEWVVTVGFSRPWDYPLSGFVVNPEKEGALYPKRDYKVLRIRSSDGSVNAVTSRA